MTIPSSAASGAADPLEPAAARRGAAEGDAGRLTLAVLHEVLLSLAHGAPREATLALLAEKACILADCASAAILLHDSDERDDALPSPSGEREDTLLFAAVSGEDSAELLGTRVRAGDTLAGNTARTGEPYLAFSPAVRPAAAGSKKPGATAPAFALSRSAAVVPLFDNGRPVGALAAQGKTGERPFGGDDLLALSLLAAVGATTLGYHRLQEDGRRQSRELSTLYEAVRSVAGQLSAQEVLNAVLEQAAAHVENSAVAVFLLNDERTHFYIAADSGLSDDQREVTLPTDHGLGATLLHATRPQFLAFAPTPAAAGEEDAAYLQPSPAATAALLDSPFPGLPARAGIAAPIRAGDVTHGLVLAVSGQPSGTYRLADANLLSALAAQAAAAMENAYLYEDATRRAEEAGALYELSQTITSTLRLDTVLDLVADSTRGLLGVDRFALFLRDRPAGAALPADRLRLVVERGLPPGAATRLQPLVGQGIPGWVVEFETPTAVQDVAADHRNRSAPLHDEGVVSLCAMPLQVGTSTIGVLCALSSRRRLFTVAEVELLYTIANQAAIAIENARIYADVRQKAQELRRYFHRVGRALGAQGSPGEVPQMIASLTLEVMGADRCALYALDDTALPRLRVEAAVNFRPAAIADDDELREDNPAGYVARRARPLTVEDLTADERFAAWLAGQRGGRLGSYLGVPLRAGKRVVGVLEVYTRAPRQWRGDEVRLLLTFASQAAVAFQNARLAAQSGRAARDVGLLRDLLALATGPAPPTPQTLIQTVADALGDGRVFFLQQSAEENGGNRLNWQVRAIARSGNAAAAAKTNAPPADDLIPNLRERLAARAASAGESGPDNGTGDQDDDLVLVRSQRFSQAVAWLPDAAAETRITDAASRPEIRELLCRAVEIFTREPTDTAGTFR